MSFDLEKMGYSKFKITENEKTLVELEDGSILETSVSIRNILYQNENSVGSIDADMIHVIYTTKESRSQQSIQPLEDVSFEQKITGKCVLEANGFEFTIIPIIIQIKRLGQRDKLGHVVYQVNANAKSMTKKL